ncbi:cell division protein FtsQ/DivIB [Halomonas piscis]|uniref:Cell division protein FtsQ n=1 Tax=Halomonas piscis TaxID=3031727 RepID=A0ABY9Z3G7_9GAMM|nr:cell division protein FtsQ/DivIB [Halomonas piscis]WNK21432.1 cell division protein FtsQ/DivIB [Halomonas piscis]
MQKRNVWLGLLLLALMLGAGGRALWLWLDTPVERVSVRGDWDYANADYLRGQLAPLVRDARWLSVDLAELRQAALEIGWVKEVRVSRQWPDALAFELVEQEPITRWNDDQLLNVEGTPFDFAPLAAPEGLPDLAGPEGSSKEVLAYYRSLEKQLGRLDLALDQLRLEPRGAWRLQLTDGAWVMLGRHQREARLARLMASWRHELNRYAGAIRYIDLRYPNGVAVAWHGDSPRTADAVSEDPS